MTFDEFSHFAVPVVRHGLTTAGAALATLGMAGAGTTLTASGLATVAASVLWSLIHANKHLAGIVDEIAASDVDLLAQTVADFRAKGASPVLVAHMAQALATVAVAELSPPPPAPVAAPVPPAAVPDPPQAVLFPAPVPPVADETHGDGA